MNRMLFVRLLPYAAVMTVLAASLAGFIAFEQQAALQLWSQAIEFVEAKWRRALFGPTGQMLLFTMLLMVMEPFFLSWEKTTVCAVFVRRNVSAITDLGFMIAYFAKLKMLAEYVLTFGLAYVGATLADAISARVGWFRLELPSHGVAEVAAGFALYYIVMSFVDYWQHRLSHWRWFWQLHRFHHAATELNILTGFRNNPADSIVNVLLALSPLVLLKVPDSGLFATFILANKVIASLQHSQLTWGFGWFGRWVIASPRMHQIHHSIDEEHRDRNFGICPLWDQLFGTWYDGPNRPTAYGIPDGAHVERPLTQWLIDVWIFYRDVARSLASVARH